MKTYVIVILLAAGCIMLFSFNIGDLSLLKGDENYYFSSARRMIRENDWITPRYHHHIRFEKPILYYWIVALFFKLFGVSWAAARMASVVFGTLTVVLVYLLALRFFTKGTAFLSSVILATSFLFLQYSRLAVIDAAFLFFITLSLFLFIKRDREGGEASVILSAISLALSVLVKGPLGLIIVMLVILTYGIGTKRYGLLKDRNLIFAVLIFLLITLPWPLIMYKIHGKDYLNHIWEVEAVDKAAGSILKFEEINNLGYFAIKYLGYYIPVVIFAFAPWGLFLPFALFKKLRTNKNEDRVFILSWFWVVLIFFSIVSFKHTHYMLLLSPPLAMIVANIFSNKRLTIAITSVTIMTYLSLAGFILPALDEGVLKSFSAILAAEIKKDEEIGIASKGFNLKKIGVYLNDLVSTPYELSGDDLAQYRNIKKGNIIHFLKSQKRVFCLISKADYESSVPSDLQKGLYILNKALMWKRFKTEAYLLPILKNDWDNLKEEVYLISNRGLK